MCVCWNSEHCSFVYWILEFCSCWVLVSDTLIYCRNGLLWYLDIKMQILSYRIFCLKKRQREREREREVSVVAKKLWCKQCPGFESYLCHEIWDHWLMYFVDFYHAFHHQPEQPRGGYLEDTQSLGRMILKFLWCAYSFFLPQIYPLLQPLHTITFSRHRLRCFMLVSKNVKLLPNVWHHGPYGYKRAGYKYNK